MKLTGKWNLVWPGDKLWLFYYSHIYYKTEAAFFLNDRKAWNQYMTGNNRWAGWEKVNGKPWGWRRGIIWWPAIYYCERKPEIYVSLLFRQWQNNGGVTSALQLPLVLLLQVDEADDDGMTVYAYWHWYSGIVKFFVTTIGNIECVCIPSGRWWHCVCSVTDGSSQLLHLLPEQK